MECQALAVAGRKVGIASLLLVLLGLTAATGVSAHGGNPNLIHGCVGGHGNLRVVGPNNACGASETALDWNIQGLAGPAGPQGPAGPPGDVFGFTCPPDSVRSGRTCIDKYEASVWETTDATVIAKIKDGTVTLADLTAAGATQRGATTTTADYGVGCPLTGNECLNLYAVSIPGVLPSRFITWFQAVAVVRNSGKRLPTSQEWQAAALGTPDQGFFPGPEDCNTFSSAGLGGVSLTPTGDRANCISDVGAFDMVGNVDEWVADWAPDNIFTGCSSGGFFDSGDLNCVGFRPASALVRGGNFVSGSSAGVFAVSSSPPASIGGTLITTGESPRGFRAAR